MKDNPNLVPQGQLTSNKAQVYEDYLVPAIYDSWAARLVKLAALQPGEQVLEVACGTGVVARLAAPLLSPDGKLIGLDLDAGMLRLAALLTCVENTQVEWQVGDAMALPFPPANFEVILCQAGLPYFADPSQGLAEMYRVLRANGRLALMTWRSIRYCPGFAVLAELLEQYLGYRAAEPIRLAFRLGAERELQQMVHLAGFRKVTLYKQVGSIRFGSIAEFIRYQWDGSSQLDLALPLNSPKRNSLENELEETLRSYVSESGIIFPIQANLVLAYK